jgi:hypothetical protein
VLQGKEHESLWGNGAGERTQRALRRTLCETRRMVDEPRVDHPQSHRFPQGSISNTPIGNPLPANTEMILPNIGHYQSHYGQAPYYFPTQPTDTSSTTMQRHLPKHVNFRKICAKCRRKKREHPTYGVSTRELFEESLYPFVHCGRCAAMFSFHENCPIGFWCTMK